MSETALQHHFDTLTQQKEASTLGMWIFLATEIMLFGGLFVGYTLFRSLFPEAWAEGAHHNSLWIGSINTFILLASSLTMALAVHAAEEGAWDIVQRFLWITALLGTIFVCLKFYEYFLHWQHHKIPGVRFSAESPLGPHVELFFFFYFVMTGLHALHMTVGIAIVGLMAVLARKRRLAYHMPVETLGLYWHFVDIVWVFLYPMLYLV